MHRTILVALSAMVIFFQGAGLASALEIVYPAHKTYFTRSNYLIVKGGDSPTLEAITIEFGGAKSDLISIASSEYKAAFGDFVILQPEFDPGRNLIKVDGYVKGKKVASAEADVYYLASYQAVPGKGYRPFVMHLAEKEAHCSGCHNMTPDAKEITMVSADANPCGSCHGRMLNEAYVHGPAGVFQCVYCHQVDSKPNKYQPRVEEAALCNECHLDKVEEFKARKFVHGPIEAGLCSVCHDSHASATFGQLVAPVNELCLGCHDAVSEAVHVIRGVNGQSHPLEGGENPSNPGDVFSCISCHDPHGGNSSFYFQRGISSRFALCQLCHKK